MYVKVELTPGQGGNWLALVNKHYRSVELEIHPDRKVVGDLEVLVAVRCTDFLQHDTFWEGSVEHVVNG